MALKRADFAAARSSATNDLSGVLLKVIAMILSKLPSAMALKRAPLASARSSAI
jgi:hypothetical protein